MLFMKKKNVDMNVCLASCVRTLKSSKVPSSIGAHRFFNFFLGIGSLCIVEYYVGLYERREHFVYTRLFQGLSIATLPMLLRTHGGSELSNFFPQMGIKLRG